MRIQFYSLNLGRHLNQKEEALCFVLLSAPSCTCRWLRGRGKVLVRMAEGLSLLIQADWSLVNHHLVSHVRVWWVFFCLFSISWSHCAQIKEQLQSRSRKRELKGLLSLSSPRFLTPLQTALASWVLREATPVRAKLYPLHPSVCFSLLKKLSEDGAGEKSWNGRGC